MANMQEAIPREIITDTRNRSVVLTPDIEAAVPHLDTAFYEVNRAFLEDSELYLQTLKNSVFRFQSSQGAYVACSLLHKEDSRNDEVLVVFSPFSDAAPRSTAEELHQYLTAKHGGGLKGIYGKEKVAPNSWHQITKSSAVCELLHALGKNIPVLTIYSPLPIRAYDRNEINRISQGDFSPAGRIAEEAISEARIRLNGSEGTTQIDTLHFAGASLGASNAIAAANVLTDPENFGVDVRTVTAQELILGPKSLFDLMHRFMFRQLVDAPSNVKTADDSTEIQETELGRMIDKYGSEPVGMNWRMLQGMKLPYMPDMQGLTRPEKTVRAVEDLLDSNVDVLVALAQNSAMTYQTKSLLPETGVQFIDIRGKEGQRIGHLADEYVALSGLVVALNILKGTK